MWSRTRLFAHDAKDSPSVERAMLSVAIGIAIVSALVAVEALLGGDVSKIASALI